MKINTFRKILHLYVLTIALILIKAIYFPYSFAPEELAKAISIYDESQFDMSGFEALFIVLIFIILFISIFKLYKWKSIGRLLFLIAVIGFHLAIFMQGYYVFDSFEYLLDAFSGILSGLILCTVYFTDLSKKFKR